MPTEPFTVLLEEEEFAVISKPAGIVVHPTADQPAAGTLTSVLVKRWPELKTAERNGLVHRLDKDTSGVLLVAKTSSAFTALTKQFADRSVKKRYTALVDGMPPVPRGRVDAPVARHYAKREKMTVHPDGRTAETTYEVTKALDDCSLLDVWPSTGRTHQIRVHLAALGNPVVGDTTYGKPQRPAGLTRQFLHAAELTFTNPTTGRQVRVTDPLPDDLQNFLNGLERA